MRRVRCWWSSRNWTATQLPKDVEAAVNLAKQVYSLYGAGDKLAISEPWDYNRLPNKTLDDAVKWMASNLQ